MKGKYHTEEAKQKISMSKKGNKYALGSIRSEEFKRNISEAKKLYWQNKKINIFIETEYCGCGCGQIVVWNKQKRCLNKFVHGHNTKGKVFSEERNKKISKALTGKKLTEEHKRKIGLKSKGRTHSEETKRKINEARKRGKGGIGGSYIDGRTIKLKEWKFLVNKRDNYICQKCGKKDLQGFDCKAHHIKTRKEYPELICDINNGVTLCKICHGFIHNKDKKASEETREKLSKIRMGHFVSEETKEKMSKSKIGELNPMYKKVKRKC